MNSFELIIFDCDGVLIDSERIANEVFAKVLEEEFGLVLNLDDTLQTFVGRSCSQCMAIVEKMLGKKALQGLEQRYKDEITQELSTSVNAVNGIEKVINELSVPYCVASSGSHKKMRTTLGRTKLLQYFDGKIFSTSDVERGKPFPDIYLHAANQMGVNQPSKCLVIEDSPTGVKGAVSAGMTVFGYSELMNKNWLLDAGAHHTFNSMNQLIRDIRTFEAKHSPRTM